MVEEDEEVNRRNRTDSEKGRDAKVRSNRHDPIKPTTPVQRPSDSDNQ
jgi:hypothetical protein